MGWEEPELQDQPVCKQLCLFCSGVSGFLWAQFSPCLAPKPFTQPICPFPHIEKGHGLLSSLCGPWDCPSGRLPTCQNHLAQDSPAVGPCSVSVLSESPCSVLRAGACPHLPRIALWMTKVINLHTQLEASASVLKGLIFLTLSSLPTVLAQLKAHHVSRSAPAPPSPPGMQWKGGLLPVSLETLCPALPSCFGAL